jgi:soluble epoxide hydrolase / lipid-phosphate phosphatase
MPDLTVSRGLTYHYQHFSPSLRNGEYVLFLHGWPSCANDWHNQIDHFRKLGWGVLAPDLLGAGRTSRPAEADMYVLKDMARDVVEILDHEKIPKVHAVGHDWGSFLLSRLAVYHPERINKACFIAVGYRAPGAPFDLEAAQKGSTKVVGYPTLGYQIFFIQDENSQDIVNQHVSNEITFERLLMFES